MPIDIDMATNSPEDQLQQCLDAGELSLSKITFQQQELLEQAKENIKKGKHQERKTSRKDRRSSRSIMTKNMPTQLPTKLVQRY